MDKFTISLTSAESDLLVEALDSHAYWQLGCDLPRVDGHVWLPTDEQSDRFWRVPPTPDQAAAAAEIERARLLAAKLREAPTSRRVGGKSPRDTARSS